MPQSKTTAIFDLDGTLIQHSSAERTFFFYLLRSGGLSSLAVLQMLGALWNAKGNFHGMVRGNKRYLRNKRVAMLEEVARNYFEQRAATMIFPTVRTILEEHRSRGDLLLLLSGTLDVIAACFARTLNLDGYRAATLEVRAHRYTGRITGTLPYGMGKLEVLRELRSRFGFDSDSTTLYANSYSDRYVMNAIQTPVAVNPDPRLRSYARKRGWKVVDTK